MKDDRIGEKIISGIFLAVFIIVLMGFETAGMSLFVAWLAEKFGDTVALITFLPLILFFLYTPSLVLGIRKYLKETNDLKVSVRDRLLHNDKVPHFGDKMLTCMAEIKGETFQPYVTHE